MATQECFGDGAVQKGESAVYKNVAHLMAIWALILVSLHLLTPRDAAGQATASLQEQLTAQYPLAKINNAGGCSISNADAVKPIVIQKPGLVAVPASSFAPKCAAHYKDGRVSPPGTLCTGSAAKKLAPWTKAIPWDKTPDLGQIPQRPIVQLQKGDAVYATAFEVNENKSEIKLSIGYCSGDGSQAMAYKGEVIFQLKSEVLKNHNVNQIEDTIAELFAVNAADSNDPPSVPGPEPGQAARENPPGDAPPAQGGTAIPMSAIVNRAVEIASYLGANRFDLVYQNYTDEMKRIGSTERMSRNWNNQIQHFGPFMKILSAEKNPNSNVVNVVCGFRDGQVNVEVVVVDPSMQIGGLWMQPAPGRHWPPKALVQ